MKLALSNFIDIEEHGKKIKRSKQFILNQFVTNSDTRGYLDKVSNYFLEHITGVCSEIHEEFFQKFNQCKSLKGLEGLIVEAKEYFLPIYEEYLRNYNSNNMLKDIPEKELKEIIDLFIKDVNKAIVKGIRYTMTKYAKELRQKKYNIWMLIFTCVAALTGVATLLATVFKYEI